MFQNLTNIFHDELATYIEAQFSNPISILFTIIDIIIVLFIIFKAFQILRETRAWQLLRGIAFLVIITLLSGLLRLNILNTVLSYVMNYAIIIMMIVFQPELRRGLEQLGTNKVSKFLGINKNIEVKIKENIYKISIAVMELSKTRKGALIVIERDIKIQDIVSTGVQISSEISPQLLINIFEPKTPLHDGAVVISGSKIAAASCMLPLSDDKDIARELGTRHRAAIGISKESDAIAIVVSEETGKVSIAKDGTLIADVREDVLKKILIKNLVNEHKQKKAAPVEEKKEN